MQVFDHAGRVNRIDERDVAGFFQRREQRRKAFGMLFVRIDHIDLHAIRHHRRRHEISH